MRAQPKDIILLKNTVFSGKRFQVKARHGNSAVVVEINHKDFVVKDTDYEVERKQPCK